MENTDLIAVNIVNPSEIALHNQIKEDPNKPYGVGTYTAGFNPLRFKKLYAEKGVGRFLLAINKYPGLTKKALFEKIFGPNSRHAAYSETFTKMKAAKIIENHRPGFYITPLGLAVLKQHNLI